VSRIKATVCSLLIVFLFVGCGQQVTGTWTLHSMEQNGVLTEGDELDAIYGGTIEYVFKSDGTLIVKMMGQEVEGVWEQKEDIVTITYNDLVSELTKNGDELILEQNGITFTIVRE
jgi:hypothetical protein